MNIGSVIRTCRKEKHMTQEEMANRLGVTAPAVNKWENNNSFPDISLLAPIARLLGISTDTLLGYEENLTEQEINQIVLEVNDKMHTDYDTAFSLAMDKIQTYPNCEKLIFNLASVLDSYRIFLSKNPSYKYEETIRELYHRLLESDNSSIVNATLGLLFSNCLSRQEYEQAQEYLNRLPRQEHNPDMYQAVLYEKQGKTHEAYQLYERLLLSGYFNASWCLLCLYHMAMKESDWDKAAWLLEKHKKLSHLLEMGPYNEFAPELELMIEKKDEAGALRILEILIDNIDNLDAFKHSDLYRHLDFSDNGTENLSFMLKQCFDGEEMAFLRDNTRFQELMKKLQES